MEPHERKCNTCIFCHENKRSITKTFNCSKGNFIGISMSYIENPNNSCHKHTPATGGLYVPRSI